MCGGVAEYDGVCYLHSCRHLGDVVSIEGAGGRTAEAVAVVCLCRPLPSRLTLFYNQEYLESARYHLYDLRMR